MALTERHDVYRPFSGYTCVGEVCHGLSSHVDKNIVTFGLSRVAIDDLQNDSASFFLDVVEQLVRRLKHIEQEMNGLFLLYSIEHIE